MPKFRKILLYVLGVIAIWIFLAQYLILRIRWSDEEACKKFSDRGVRVAIQDTVINQSHLHYASTGLDTLPTLVFIHGSPGSWMKYASYLWDSSLRKKFRMVSIDRPGFGYSDFGKAMHLRDQSSLLIPVLNTLKNGRPLYLFGHSLGGAVVVQLAAAAPELVNGIIIAAGAIDIAQEEKETWRRVMQVKPFYWALPGAYGPSNTELLYLKEDLIPLQKEFNKVICEVHFIHGTNDTKVPIENVAFGRRMLINAKRITVDTIVGADHDIPWRNNDRIANLLLKLY